MSDISKHLTEDGRVELNDDELRQKINLETGRLSWPELARFFARGVVIKAAPKLDMIEAAARIAENDTRTVEAWMQSGQLQRADDDDARAWNERGAEFWSVVVAPWVLVQEIEKNNDHGGRG